MEGLPDDINRELSKVLEYDEKPIDFRAEPWSYYKRRRWVILTNKRIYLIKKVFFGLSFDITQIVLTQGHFELVEGVILDTIYIRVPSEGEHIINLFSTERASTVRFFEEMERNRERQQVERQQQAEDTQKIVAMAELEALAKTFYENKITSKEYREKKKRLIDKM